MSKLIFFLGGAGAGKTTLAKAMAGRRRAALLDMDTLLRPAAEAMMALAGLDPNDRDSADYKLLCRDLGYRITMDAALENIAIGMDAYVIGPFTKETDSPQWLQQELARIGETMHEVEVKVLFVMLPDEQQYRERIEARSSVLDAWKLEHWPTFRMSLAKREIRWPLPESSIIYFDNTGPFSLEKVERAERLLYGDT